MAAAHGSAGTRTVAVGLVRASTDKQAASTADQRKRIEEWARDTGHDLVRVFEDNAVSGWRLDRPGLQALLGHVERQRTGGVVVLWDRSRLVRPEDPRDGLVLERQIERAGWSLHYLHGENSTGDPFVDMIKSGLAHHKNGQYLPDVAASTLRGQHGAVLAGSANGNRTPYGYVRVCVAESGARRVVERTAKHRRAPGERVTFAPGDEDEVGVVRWMFAAIASGEHSTVSAAQDLNRRQVPSPTGGLWIDETVRRVVKNPVYCGDLAWNRTTSAKFSEVRGGKVTKAQGRKRAHEAGDVVIVRDHHEALVSRDTWQRANAAMSARGQQRGHGRYVKQKHPLSGRVVCGGCGQSMRITSYAVDGPDSFICKSPKVTGTCELFQIRSDRLERAVILRLREAFLPHRSHVEARVRELLGADAEAPAQPQVEALRRELEGVTRRIEASVENLTRVTGIAAERLAAKLTELQQRHAEIERQLGQAVASEPTPTSVDEATAEAMAIFDELERVGPDAPDEARRELFARSVGSVEVDYRTEQRGAKRFHRPTGGRVFLPNLLARLAASLLVGATLVCTSEGRAHVLLSADDLAA